MELSKEVLLFLKKQKVVAVTTFDSQARIHCAVKGIVGLEPEGKVFVVDLYKGRTYKNLVKNSVVSITAVNEKKFEGFTLQGTAQIVLRKNISHHLVESWENKIIERISERIVSSIQSGKKTKANFEAELPLHPKYLIEIDVENVINLTPPRRRTKKLDR